VQIFTSNWKELYTLLCTLRWDQYTGRLVGRHVFYFTDNTILYHICQQGSSKVPSLHPLVREIKLLCAKLSVVLEVVHVPGLAIIWEGTDGLSHPPHPDRLMPHQEVARLFWAAKVMPFLYDWAMVRRAAVDLHHIPRDWITVSVEESWHPDRFMRRATIWAPPPRIASQAIAGALAAWVEFPHNTKALFFVLRLCTRTGLASTVPCKPSEF